MDNTPDADASIRHPDSLSLVANGYAASGIFWTISGSFSNMIVILESLLPLPLALFQSSKIFTYGVQFLDFRNSRLQY